MGRGEQRGVGQLSSGNTGVRHRMKDRISGSGFHTWTVSVRSEDGRFVLNPFCFPPVVLRAEAHALAGLLIPPSCEQVVLCVVGRRQDKNTNSKTSRGSTGCSREVESLMDIWER